MSASESYRIEPPEPGQPVQQACRIVAQSSDIDRRILRSLSEGAKRYSELKPVLDGRNDHNLTVALKRLQREGLIRRRSGGGEGRDVHRYELSGLGRHTLLAIDEIQEVGSQGSQRPSVETSPIGLEGLVGQVLEVAGVEADEQQIQAIVSELEAEAQARGTGSQTATPSRGRSTWHVTATEDGRWRVIRENASRAASVHDTKDEAVDAAREIAKKRSKGQVVLHRQDGTIQKAHSYRS